MDDIFEEIFLKIKEQGFFDFNTNSIYHDALRSLRHDKYLTNEGGTNNTRFITTSLGRKVISSGGWKLHVKNENKKDRLYYRKLIYEHGISRAKYYTFWPALILGIIGGVYSVYDFIKSYKADTQTTKLLPMEQSKSHTSHEDQKTEIHPLLKTLDTVSYQEKTIKDNIYP